jgi:hypothetical protein
MQSTDTGIITKSDLTLTIGTADDEIDLEVKITVPDTLVSFLLWRQITSLLTVPIYFSKQHAALD